MGFRFSLLIGITGILYATLLFRLYGVQVKSGEYYLAKAEAQYDATYGVAAYRGGIFFTDKNGVLAGTAVNKKFPELYAVPKAIDDPLEAAYQIAPIIGEDAEKLKSRLSGGGSYALLVRRAVPDVIEAVRALGLRGVYTQDAPARSYPFGPLGAHLIGFSGPNAADYGESGKYGIERFYEDRLSGGVSGEGAFLTPVPGEDVALTVDLEVQRQAGYVLKRLVDEYRARGGSVIVEDPRSGKILAMESLPSFDPNQYQESPIGNFLNPAIEKLYEPGSVMKVITMAAGIDSGAITPETSFFDSGELAVSGKVIKNWDLKGHGNVTMKNVIEESINTGAAFAERKTGHEVFRNYLAAFGFEEKTGVDLPGEVPGDMRTLREKAPAINFATAAFGQGIAVTPIEMVNAFSAIANGGTLMRPYVNAALDPTVVRKVIAPETARNITDMMVSAVDKAGVAAIDGFRVAGKTGTAQVPDFVRGGYTHRVVNTYIGFAPARDPKFVILIKLDEPEGAPLAGLTVVPAFRDLAQFLLNYYGVQPDRL